MVYLKKGGSKSEDGNSGEKVYDGDVLLSKNLIKPDGSLVVNPIGWWASEKFDGYRAIWNGSEFVSRNNKIYQTPKWFSAIMPPNITIDGELWQGRDRYEDCGLFRKDTPIDEEWYPVTFRVFDIILLDKPFEERQDILSELVETRCTFMQSKYYREQYGKYLPKDYQCPLQLTNQHLIETEEELKGLFDSIVKDKGEGLMLRKPNSLYEPKKSNTLLKMKPSYDTECKIVGYSPGKGKNDGRLGAFECQLLKGTQTVFKVSGMNDSVRDSYLETHPIGTIITIKYNDFTKKGIPRFAQYLRKRSDMDLVTKESPIDQMRELIDKYPDWDSNDLIEMDRITSDKPRKDFLRIMKTGIYNLFRDLRGDDSQPFIEEIKRLFRKWTKILKTFPKK